MPAKVKAILAKTRNLGSQLEKSFILPSAETLDRRQYLTLLEPHHNRSHKDDMVERQID